MSTNKLSPLSWFLIIGAVAYWAFVLADASGPPPIAGDGLRVLIVEETENRVNLTPDQREIILSRADGGVLSYLDSHCPKGPDGRTPEWRILDKDQDLSADSPYWKEAFARTRSTLPWIVASNGRTGFEGPLDMKPAELLVKLKKLGGE